MSSMPEQPTNETNDAVGPEVHIPGPYPTAEGDPTGEPMSSESEPTKETRESGSLGDLTEDVSTSPIAEESGGMGSPIFDEESTAKKA